MLTIFYLILAITSFSMQLHSGDQLKTLLIFLYFFMLAITSYFLNYTRKSLLGYTDLLYPLNVAINTFGLYFGLSLLLTSDITVETVSYLLFFLISTLFSVFIFSRTKFLAFLRRFNFKFEHYSLHKSKILRYRIIIILPACIALFCFLALSAGMTPLEVISKQWEFRLFSNRNGVSYITLVMNFFLFSSVIITFLGLANSTKKNILDIILFLISTLVFTYISLASGVRALLIFGVFSFLICTHIMKKNINNTTMIAFTVIMFPVLYVLGETRAAGVNNGSLSLDDVSKILLNTDYGAIISAVVDRLDALKNFNLLLKWTHESPNNIEFQFGLTYILAPLQAVPRNLWSEKPLLPAEYLTHIIIPNATNYTLDFSVLGEAYLNFSWLGCPLIGSICGIFLVILTKLYLKAILVKNELSAIYVTLSWIFPMATFTTGLVPIFILTLTSILLFYLYIKIYFKKIICSFSSTDCRANK